MATAWPRVRSYFTLKFMLRKSLRRRIRISSLYLSLKPSRVIVSSILSSREKLCLRKCLYVVDVSPEDT